MLNYKNKICQVIAKDDDMYLNNKDHYFGVGESALKNILVSLKIANKNECQSILDMPSGYGRVLRYLKAEFPDANITASDLDRKMVDFCIETFKVKGMYSNKNLNSLKIEEKFDLIWCGSLFTHLNKNLWCSFFKFFYENLTEKGIVVFTVHGKFVAERLINNVCDYGLHKDKISSVFDNYIKTGFGYANYPNNSEYGISISSFPWIYSELSKLKGFRIILFSEQGWDNHQDVIACIRENK